MQEYVPKIIELVTSNWDMNLQVAGLKLLNALHIPNNTHSLLRRLLPNFMEILLMANTLAKVQNYSDISSPFSMLSDPRWPWSFQKSRNAASATMPTNIH